MLAIKESSVNRYTLIHKEEDNNWEYNHVDVVREVSKGWLMKHLLAIPIALRYQYVVFEYDFIGDQCLDHQNADEWLADYNRIFEATDGLTTGDVVSSIHKNHMVYQVVRVLKHNVWIRPYDEEAEQCFGNIKKGILPYTLVKL